MKRSILFAAPLGLFCAAAVGAGCHSEPTVVVPHDPNVVLAATPPPPISGGTLLVTADERRAVAADPDRDVVWIANLDTQKLEHEIELEAGDEPGRLVEAAGKIHVALRGAGALVTIDPEKGTVVRRADLCGAPRGLAFDAATGLLHAACTEGKLVSLDAATGKEVRRLALDEDLRDVVVQGDKLLVSRFRSAEVLLLDASGGLVSRAVAPEAAIPDFSVFEGDQGAGGAPGDEFPLAHFTPVVGWRTVAGPGGGVLMVHQRARQEEITTEEPGGYAGGGCGSITHGALTEFGVSADGALTPPDVANTLFGSVLPVDVAVSKGGQVAVAAAGTGEVLVAGSHDLEVPADSSCGLASIFLDDSPTAVAFKGEDIVVQMRQPPAIEILGVGRIELPGVSVRDTGHDLFHKPPSHVGGTMHQFDEDDFADEAGSAGGFAGPGSAGIACASCHPEGGDDSHVWTFDALGPRRTQSMRGGILATAPLHWGGDMDSLDSIMSEVFVRRMGGVEQGPGRVKALARWVDALPAPPPVRSPDDEAAQRGKALFEDQTVGCATCHNGPHLTNNTNVTVGKGSEPLQVPALVGVAWRAPFMHDGCAATLLDRFDPACGGTQHGDVSKLSEADIADLVAYLETL